MDLLKLKDVFPEQDIEWRSQSCGKSNGKIWCICLAYITNRAIMDRLDQVCGPANWKNEYLPGPSGGVVCGISIRVPMGDGTYEWITKWDGAENTDIDSVKGGLSNSMKRAAVQWGIGRYLYNLEEGFAEVAEKGAYRGKTKDGDNFRWNPPRLPAWALPAENQPDKPAAKPAPDPEVSSEKKETDDVGGDQSKVKSALVKLATAGTMDQLVKIEDHADKLLAAGTITKAQRGTIQRGILRASERIQGVLASPYNPENKS